MKKSLALFSAVSIFLWVMPLGAFIKSSQEKKACGGGRAFHMCTMGMAHARKAPSPEKISFTNASGAEKTNKPASGAGGNNVLIQHSTCLPAEIHSRTIDTYFFKPRNPFIFSIDPVPKY